MVRPKDPDIRFKPRYVKKEEDDTHVLAYDYKTGQSTLFTKHEWEAKKGFLMLVINGEIIP